MSMPFSQCICWWRRGEVQSTATSVWFGARGSDLFMAPCIDMISATTGVALSQSTGVSMVLALDFLTIAQSSLFQERGFERNPIRFDIRAQTTQDPQIGCVGLHSGRVQKC